MRVMSCKGGIVSYQPLHNAAAAAGAGPRLAYVRLTALLGFRSLFHRFLAS